MKKIIVISNQYEITYHDKFCGDKDNPGACKYYGLDTGMASQFDGCRLFNIKFLWGSWLERERCQECLKYLS
jgi:hypothetical protein